jgi:hypothetical protein
MIACKNCETNFEGNYCPNCGQKFIERRFNMKDSLVWLFNSIFNLDRGFFHTSIQLIKQPGEVISKVLNGVTVRYTHPFRLLFIWATISTLLVVVFGVYDQTTDLVQDPNLTEEQIRVQTQMKELMKKYLSFIIMLIVPMVSFFSWLFYRKLQLNYAEHLVINAYALAMTTFIGIPIIFAQYFFHYTGIFTGISMFLNVALVAYVYSAFFKENYFASFFKFLLGFILGYIGLFVIGILFGMAYFVLTH